MSGTLNPSPEPDRDTSERSQVEIALKSLAPAPSRIDRDRLMYLAGQASAVADAASVRDGRSAPADAGSVGHGPLRPLPSRRLRIDLLAASAASLLAGWLLSAAIVPPWIGEGGAVARVPRVRPAVGEARDGAAPTEPAPLVEPVRADTVNDGSLAAIDGSYLRARNIVLARGVDAWGELSANAGSSALPLDVRSLRRELLDPL